MARDFMSGRIAVIWFVFSSEMARNYGARFPLQRDINHKIAYIIGQGLQTTLPKCSAVSEIGREMTDNITGINLKVVILDSDFYAMDAINGYLAWDRRTRVTFMAESLDSLWDHIEKTPLAELPDIITLDADHVGGAAALVETIRRLRQQVEGVQIICLTQNADPHLVEAAAKAGSSGYLLKDEIRSQIAWAIVYALDNDFIVTPGIARLEVRHNRFFNATTLPRQYDYPELTDRIRQAIELCVVKGMPAHLAADEMGISLHTIRSYVKEGYRILESYDETEYPVDMSPQERAFMRLTRFTDEEE
jgi:DNA-binding NarL/FixJ family response regulator